MTVKIPLSEYLKAFRCVGWRTTYTFVRMQSLVEITLKVISYAPGWTKSAGYGTDGAPVVGGELLLSLQHSSTCLGMDDECRMLAN